MSPPLLTRSRETHHHPEESWVRTRQRRRAGGSMTSSAGPRRRRARPRQERQGKRSSTAAEPRPTSVWNCLRKVYRTRTSDASPTIARTTPAHTPATTAARCAPFSQIRLRPRTVFARWVADEYATLELSASRRLRPCRGRSCARSASFIWSTSAMTIAGRPRAGDVRLGPPTRPRVRGADAQRRLALSCDRIHGRLSWYNVLYHDGDCRISTSRQPSTRASIRTHRSC